MIFPIDIPLQVLEINFSPHKKKYTNLNSTFTEFWKAPTLPPKYQSRYKPQKSY